ncbi:hypothetical protein [uncultured Psychrobacter sp.]|uniref:defense against restriction DarA-related protein n=1 Tax=uncultured Psychrobacter sp. TaxID=259303 RepID=UPI002596AF1F|nr:hypothetical protein [uncultured Psychrobacter sp.]
MTYIPVNKANTNHKSRDDNGREIARYSRYETGVIDGKNRELLAVIADQAGFDGMGFDASIGSGDDSWHVANVFDSNRRYVDTMVIGGAFDSLHAKQVADSQLHRLRGDNCVIVTNPQFDSLSDDKPDTWSLDAINKLLANPSQNKSYLPVVTAQELNFEAARVTFDAVQWDSMDGLVSHGGSDSALFLDLIRADGHKQLLEPLNLVRELELLGAEEHSFDALMDKKVRLTLLKDRLFNAMSRAGDAELSVTNVTETKPFKRQGVTNIAFVFDLSDGQKLSIWFHNPDSTPSQLKADDVMISWKWMLNKRDVTAVLSPKQGDNVQLPVLAARIMRVARKNSKKFKAAQDRAAALEQELQDAQALVDAKQGEINQLDTDIAGLNAAIDAAMAKKAEEPTTPPEMTEKEQKEKRERERVLAMQFDEVTQFYKNNGAEPSASANDIIEKMLAKRLESIRANAEFVEYLAPYDTYNLLNDEPAPDVLSNSANNEVPPFSVGDPVVWRNEIGEMKGTFRGMVGQNIFIMTDDGQMGAPATEVFADDSAPKATPASGKSDIDAMITKAANEDFDDYSFWIATATVADVKALTEKQFYKLSAALEDVNMHGEHLYLAAMRTGNAEWIAEAKSINDANKTGLTPELSDRRSALWALINGEAAPVQATDNIPSHAGLAKNSAIAYMQKLLDFARQDWTPSANYEDVKDWSTDDLIALRQKDEKALEDEKQEVLKRAGHVYHNKSYKKDADEIQDLGNQINAAYERTPYGDKPSQSQQLFAYWKDIAKKHHEAKKEAANQTAPEPVDDTVDDTIPSKTVAIRDALDVLKNDVFKGQTDKVLMYTLNDAGDIVHWSFIKASSKSAQTRFTNKHLYEAGVKTVMTANIPDNIQAAARQLETLGYTIDYSDPEGFTSDDYTVGDVYEMKRKDVFGNSAVEPDDTIIMEFTEWLFLRRGEDAAKLRLATLSGSNSVNLTVAEMDAIVSRGDARRLTQPEIDAAREFEDTKLISTYVNNKGRVLAEVFLQEGVYDIKSSDGSSLGLADVGQVTEKLKAIKSRNASMKHQSGQDFLRDDGGKTYPPVEYDEEEREYIAYMNNKKVDKWTAYQVSGGDWAVVADNAQSRAFNSWNPKYFDNVDQLLAAYPAFKGIKALIAQAEQDDYESIDSSRFPSMFLERHADKLQTLGITDDDIQYRHDDDSDNLYVEAGIFKDKTLNYTDAVCNVVDAAISLYADVAVSDFNATVYQDSLFDSLTSQSKPTYGVTVQIVKFDATVRAKIDIDGTCEILQGASGEDVVATIKHRYTENTQPYIDAIDKAFQAQSDKKAADAAALQAEIDKKEAENMKNTVQTNSSNEPKTYPPVEYLGEGRYRAYKDASKKEYWTASRINGVSKNPFAVTANFEGGVTEENKSKTYKWDEELIAAYPAFQSIKNIHKLVGVSEEDWPLFTELDNDRYRAYKDASKKDHWTMSYDEYGQYWVIDPNFDGDLDRGFKFSDINDLLQSYPEFAGVDKVIKAKADAAKAENGSAYKRADSYDNDAWNKNRKPNAREQLIIDAVKQALNEGINASYAIQERVAEILNVSQEDIKFRAEITANRKGEFNTDIREAINYIERSATPTNSSDDNSELSKQLADLESAVNAEGFNPADFDTKGFIELVTATADDAELTARVMAISSVYQQKLVAASMAAMTSLAGGA